ncbi:MAG TPA: S41 family peptidase [Roseimicrobium sp.]|nr:S41 family peptidase [Roseimicrobium sp.]
MNSRLFRRSISLSAACLLVGFGAGAAETQKSVRFEEVYSLIKSNLPSLKPADLERDAVEGLMNQLRGKVALVDGKKDLAADPSSVKAIASTNIFDGAYGMVRVGQVKAGLPAEVTAAVRALNGGDKLKGLVIDLRFAAGDDYEAAAKTADLFVAKEKSLLQRGGTTYKSTSKTNAIVLPLAILVNGETEGASEALAAVLREQKAGLIIGTTSAGAALQFKEFTLSNGQILRIANGTVNLPSGPALSVQGVQPDITISVPADDERAYLEDPYRTLARGVGDSASRSRRTNEAELVRRHRDGLSTDELSPGGAKSPGTLQVVQDPALARGLDLLKGIAFLKQAKTP